MSVASTAYMGCFTLSAGSTTDVSGANCNSNYCPDCFIISGGTSHTIQNCPGKVAATGGDYTAANSYVRVYTFINTSGASTTVKDGETTTTADKVLAAGQSA